MCFSAMSARISGNEIIRSEIVPVTSIIEKGFDNIDPSKIPGEDNRFYPKWWTRVLREHKGEVEFTPLRYQLLPHFCKENRYTSLNPKTGRKNELKTFNARLDGLANRAAWKNIFGRKHCVVPIKAFYEWVPYQGKVRQIEFLPESNEILWVACLWDHWEGKDEVVESFAMITDEPHPDVSRMGHDRTPIILKEDVIRYWLHPENESIDDLYDILEQKKPLHFKWNWVQKQ